MLRLIPALALCRGAASFAHPGVFLGAAQLAYARSQALAGAAPFAAALAKALASPLGAFSYAPAGPPASRVIECGSYSQPNHGCSAEDADGAAAFLQLVLYNITGDARHAGVATAILRAYARGLDGYNNSNAPLQAAWGLSKWARAAELAAHLPGVGWSAADGAAFVAMLKRAALPHVIDGSKSNGARPRRAPTGRAPPLSAPAPSAHSQRGTLTAPVPPPARARARAPAGNWELSQIEGLIGFSVLTDNSTLFDRAVTFWRERVPAYFYNFNSDGGRPRPAPRGAPSWYGQTIFDAHTSGVAQETCRDEGHTTYAVAAASNAAETALLQGVDLWGAEAARLATAFEFNARLLLAGVASPPDLCGGRPVDAHAELPSYEVALAALGGRRGLPLPNVRAHVLASVRTNANPVDAHMIVYETLTHGGVPPA
jgi:hypothetical protein